MRFYTTQHRFYCGVDLHARTMHVCVIDQRGDKLVHRNIPTDPRRFLQLITPYREDVVVSVECMFAWYWLADLCVEQGIPFILGHALYMKAIHGGKAKNDAIDSYKIAALARGGTFPVAYVYPRGMRATRDLLRRRCFFKRKRAELISHIRNTSTQYNLPDLPAKIRYKRNRKGLTDHFPDPDVKLSIEADLQLIDSYDEVLRKLELEITRTAKVYDPQAYHRLRTVPGIGPILSLVLLFEIHDIRRFPSVQDFASYCRLVKCSKESAGKRMGYSGKKIGNAHLKWGFSEAATLFIRKNPEGKKLYDRLKRKHGKGKCLSVLAHKIGRAVYYMLTRRQAFDMDTFLNLKTPAGAGEPGV